MDEERAEEKVEESPPAAEPFRIPFPPPEKWIPLAEVAAFYLLVIVATWAEDWRPPAVILVAILLGTCAGSNLYHRDTAKRIGFSLGDFWPCARLVAIITVPLLIPLWIAAYRNRFWFPWDTAFAVAGYPVWSFAQEYALLGFAANRLEDGLGEHRAVIPWVNGFLFSMAHLPNPVLMTATFVAGVIFTWIFFRRRQLIPIALAHALFGVGIALALGHINGVMSVGPGYARSVGNPPLGF